MEDSSNFVKRDRLPDGKTELFSIYYDVFQSSFNEILLLEHLAMMIAQDKNWLVFKAFPSDDIGPYIVGKN